MKTFAEYIENSWAIMRDHPNLPWDQMTQHQSRKVERLLNHHGFRDSSGEIDEYNTLALNVGGVFYRIDGSGRIL